MPWIGGLLGGSPAPEALVPEHTWQRSGLQWDHRAILALPESLLLDHRITRPTADCLRQL